MKKVITFIFVIASLSIIYAQEKTETEKLVVFSAHFQFGSSIPAGDLAKRFGADNSPQVALDFLTKNDLIFGGELQFFFGNKVKEDPLINLRTPEGFLIGNDLELASISLKERGRYVGFFIGKLFQVGGDSRANGIRATIGGGWMQHQIRIQDNTRNATQIAGDYLKGYDRLRGGFAVTQFVGYQYFSRSKRVNFFAGLSAQEGFTKNLRSFDFATKTADFSRKIDIRLGLVAGWALPFYLGEKGEDKYY